MIQHDFFDADFDVHTYLFKDIHENGDVLVAIASSSPCISSMMTRRGKNDIVESDRRQGDPRVLTLNAVFLLLQFILSK